MSADPGSGFLTADQGPSLTQVSVGVPGLQQQGIPQKRSGNTHSLPSGTSASSIPLWEAGAQGVRNDTYKRWGRGAAHLGSGTEHAPCCLAPRFSSPSLPEAQAFQGGLVVQEYPEDPEGEKKPSDPEESSAPSLGAPALGWASLGTLADKRRDRGDKRHTPAGPAARSCPSKVPEHPGWEWGSQKKVIGNVHTKHRAAWGRSWLGRRGLCVLGTRPEARPHPQAGGGRLSAPLTGMPEKMGSPREGQEHSPGSP